MKNIFRLTVAILTVIACVSRTPQACAAENTIHKIEMNVYIDNDGTVNVEETWRVLLSDGTEGYKPYGNLDNSKIRDFSVTDDTGTVYETLSRWDVNAGFNEKAFKCGINSTSDGVELCWGISEYGNRTYTLKYKITGFVSQYNDAQVVYFSFMPKEMKQSPGSVVISITSDASFSESNARIWAFGYDGEIFFKNGAIVMDSEGSLRTSGYMVALIKLDKDAFNTDNRVNGYFQKVYDRAVEGSDYGTVETDKSILIKAVLFLSLMFIIVMLFGKGKRRNAKQRRHIWNGVDIGTDIPSAKIADYWREVPCGKNIKVAYWLMLAYGISPESGSRSGLMGAQLLDWLRDGSIKVTKLPKKLLGKDDNYAVDLRGFTVAGNGLEAKLAEILKKAAGSNGVLEPKEFEKWCRRNYTEVISWFEAVENYVEERLIEDKYVVAETVPSKSRLGRMLGLKKTTKKVGSEMRGEAIKLQGLKRFFMDFSAIAGREVFEIALWEDYLIFAHLLCVAGKISEQLRKVYPDFGEYSRMDVDVGVSVTADFALLGYMAAHAGYSASRSSGGGGSSSGGGGGGSIGGSSGGGFR